MEEPVQNNIYLQQTYFSFVGVLNNVYSWVF